MPELSCLQESLHPFLCVTGSDVGTGKLAKGLIHLLDDLSSQLPVSGLCSLSCGAHDFSKGIQMGKRHGRSCLILEPVEGIVGIRGKILVQTALFGGLDNSINKLLVEVGVDHYPGLLRLLIRIPAKVFQLFGGQPLLLGDLIGPCPPNETGKRSKSGGG